MAIKPIEILIRARDEASTLLTGVQAKVLAVGAAVASFVGIGLFAGAVRSAADFEAAMSRVKAATDGTDDELKELRQAAEEAGASTKFTSVQAAEALENLAKAGLSAKDAIAALPAVLSLAQAGDIELGVASEYVTKAVMGMGLAFKDAGRVADVLAMGANASNTSVTGLAQALSYAAPVAHSLGLGLEATVAIIGKFADAGIDASRAGTALNSILSQFADPASKFRQELGAAGIVTTNFEQALRELAEAGPRGQKAINAVGMEAGPALRALLGQGIGALDDLKRKLDESSGSAAATAATMQNNLHGALNGLSSAWDTVKNVLGTPVLPVLKDGVEQLAGALRSAVADGTVGKFGNAMATAFQAGIKWARDFLAQINFTQLAADMRAFADRANEVFTQIGEYASAAGNSVKLAYGVMSAGVNTVLAAIYGIGTAFTETAAFIVRAGISINEQLQKIAIGDAKDRIIRETEQMRLVLDGLGQAGDDFSVRMRSSLGSAAKGAQIARDGFAGLAQTVNDAGPAVDSTSKAIADMARQIEAAGQKTIAAAKATNDKRAADEAAAANLRQLRQEYSDLVGSGSLQAAAEKLQEINKVMSAAPEAAKSAEEAAARVEQAYRNLGMKTGQELTEAADLARGSFDALVTAGVKSASTLRQAFETYARSEMDLAERQGAAAVATAQRMLAAKASAAGLAVEVDALGKVIVRTMRDAKKATDDVNDSARGAAGGYREMGQSAQQTAESIKRLREIQQRQLLDPGDPEKSPLQNLYDRYALNGKDSKDAIEASRKNVSGNAAILQTDINQQIKDRYGEEFIGNAKAEQAFQRRLELDNYRKNYGNVARSQQSLNEQRNIAAELERLEREIEEERQARKNGGGSSSSNRDRVQASSGGAQSSGSGSGVTQVTTYQSTVVLPNGQRRNVAYADRTSQSLGDQLMRELAEGKGVLQ